MFSSSSFVLSIPTPPAPPGGYQSAHDVTRAAILGTLRLPALASVAGVQADVWASTASPRVLTGDRQGYVAGLHRGRLPAIEVWSESEAWTREAEAGGALSTTWALRVHTPGPSLEQADARARLILAAAISLLRAAPGLEHGQQESSGALVASPFGFALEMRFSLVHSYGRDASEVTSA